MCVVCVVSVCAAHTVLVHTCALLSYDRVSVGVFSSRRFHRRGRSFLDVRAFSVTSFCTSIFPGLSSVVDLITVYLNGRVPSVIVRYIYMHVQNQAAILFRLAK